MAKYRALFRKVEAATGTSRRTRRNSDPNAEAAKHAVSDWGKGEGNEVFPLAVYQWFHGLEDTSYATAIDWAVKAFLEQQPSTLSSNATALHTPIWFPREQFLNDDRSNWLSPYVYDALPFEGRQAELKRLNDFANDERQFLLWALQGPGGVGKTRLATHWIRELQSIEASAPRWNAGFLTRDARKTWNAAGRSWSTWSPDSPTVIVADYLHTFGADVAEIFQRFAGLRNESSPPHKVRLLLIDHAVSPSLRDLYQDPRLAGLSVGGSAGHAQAEAFFDTAPLVLGAFADETQLLQSVVRSAATIHGSSPTEIAVKDAVEAIAGIPAAASPLFAALAGQSLHRGTGPASASRRDLIENYMTSVDRLPWKALRDRPPLGDLIGCLTCVLSMRGGASVYDLLSAPNVQIPADDSDFVRSYLGYLTGTTAVMLPPLSPDLLSETFFLLFIERALLDTGLFQTFIEALSALADTPDNATQCLHFLDRTIGNLALDDPGYQKRFFVALVAFFGRARPKSVPLRHALAIAHLALLKAIAPQDSDLKSAPSIISALSGKLDPLFAIAAATKAVPVYEIALQTDQQKAAEALEYFLRHVSNPESWGGVAPTTALHLAATDGLQLVAEKLLAGLESGRLNEHDYGGNTPLTNACWGGHFSVVQSLLAAGADVNTPDNEGHTPLIAAISNGRWRTALHLLATPDSDVDAHCGHGNTALYLAAMVGQADVVEAIIKRRANLDFVSPLGGETALMVAAERGHVETVQQLIDAGADLNIVRPDGNTAITFATKNHQLEVARLLLRQRHLKPDSGASPILLAVLADEEPILRELLARHDLDPDHIWGQSEYTALDAACRLSDERYLSILLGDPRIDPNVLLPTGRRALYSAVANQNKGALRTLLKDDRLDASLPVGDEGTVLIAGIRAHDLQAVEVVLDVGRIDINARWTDGLTPLMVACAIGDLPVMKRILETPKLDFEAKTEVGMTAPGFAIVYDRGECLEHLLTAGLIQPSDEIGGVSLPALAANHGSLETLRVLLQRESLQLNQLDEWGYSPLLRAAQEGQAAAMQMLLERSDLDPNLADAKGLAAIHYALHARSAESVRLLVQDRRTNVNQRAPNLDMTPLLLAAAIGDVASTQELLKSDALDFTQLYQGKSALHLALQCNNKEVAELISEANAQDFAFWRE